MKIRFHASIDETKPTGILWIIQVAALCAIVIWLINPTSFNIFNLLGYVVIWIITTLFISGPSFLRMYLKKPMITMLAWPLVLSFYALFGHAEFSLSYIMYFMCFGIGVYYLTIRDKKSCVVVLLVTGTYLSIICFSTLKAYSTFPTISRLLARGDSEEIIRQGGGKFITPYIAGYGVVYGFVFLNIALMSLMENARIHIKVLSVFLFVLFTFVIIRSQYMIALMLLIVSIVLKRIESRETSREKLVAVIMAIFIVIVVFVLGPILFSALSRLTNIGVNLSLRFSQIASFLSGQDSSGTDIASRSSAYATSINSFFEHIIFGIGTNENALLGNGDHSTILDAFAQFGVVGAIPYFYFYTSPLREMKKHVSAKGKSILKISFIVLLILAFVNRANTRPNYAIIYIIIPLMIQMGDASNPTEA